MFVQHKLTFLKGALSFAGMPQTTLPEIAFLGRSNVGKSSLLNALWGRKKMAYVSKTPGKTAEINFFQVDDFCICVDFPGYGFARKAPQVKQAWQRVIPPYFEKRNQLLLSVVLLDLRHLPKESDLEVLCWLERLGRKILIIWTKKDTIPHKDQEKRLQENQQIITLSLKQPFESLVFSVKDKERVKQLQKLLKKIVLNGF